MNLARHSRRAADEVQVRYQSQDGETDRPDDSAERAGKSGPSYSLGVSRERKAEPNTRARHGDRASLRTLGADTNTSHEHVF